MRTSPNDSNRLFLQRQYQHGNMQGLGMFTIVFFAILTYFVMTFVPPWYNSWQAKSSVVNSLRGSNVEEIDEDQVKEKIIRLFKKEFQADISEDDINVVINTELAEIRVDILWNCKVIYPFTSKWLIWKFKIGATISGIKRG